MKNYKQILEAVDRGIKFALDDFEDQDDIQGQVNSKVNNTSNLKEYLEWNNLIDNKIKNSMCLLNGWISVKETNRLAELSKQFNIKYKVNSKDELDKIITCIIDVNYKANLNWIDTSSIKDMSILFKDAEFDGDISEWDVSNVINMESMFENSSFNQDISNWNVDNVRYTRFIFYNCPIKDEYKPNLKYEKL